jgi:hypothetical protein
VEELTGQAYRFGAAGRVAGEGHARDPRRPEHQRRGPFSLPREQWPTRAVRAIFEKAADGTVLADAFLRDVVVVPPPTTIAEPHGRGEALKATLLVQGVALACARRPLGDGEGDAVVVSRAGVSSRSAAT